LLRHFNWFAEQATNINAKLQNAFKIWINVDGCI